MSLKRVPPPGKDADPPSLRARRAAAAIVLAIGAVLLALAVMWSPPLRGACILLGLVLALPALICLGVDLWLRIAVRAVESSRPKDD